MVIRAPPDDEVSSMMPLVTHASPDETASLVDLAQDSSEEEDEEDLQLEHPGQYKPSAVCLHPNCFCSTQISPRSMSTVCLPSFINKFDL